MKVRHRKYLPNINLKQIMETEFHNNNTYNVHVLKFYDFHFLKGCIHNNTMNNKHSKSLSFVLYSIHLKC